MQSITVMLSISPEEYLRWYQGTASDVLATSQDGRTVQFPARILQKFVTGDGIQGTFVLRYDEAGRFVAIERRNPSGRRDLFV